MEHWPEHPALYDVSHSLDHNTVGKDNFSLRHIFLAVDSRSRRLTLIFIRFITISLIHLISTMTFWHFHITNQNKKSDHFNLGVFYLYVFYIFYFPSKFEIERVYQIG